MSEKTTTNLRAAVKRRIAQIEGMTLVEIQRVMMDCMSERSAGRMTACEGNALRRALNKRVSILGQDLSRKGLRAAGKAPPTCGKE
ncbi:MULTISPECIES: hypothetical protein [unclassified Bradyrhizobium]|uniref:hypothetical protein n=1 Tax=unclassified Bradyrhizobium TaxID=2631580 RepID=UPI0012EC6C75|nr:MULTISPECIES: hypothetical protein [unclassified Bradyrhizobium]MCK7667466.1 hypothetical protein [Bradyrhizobium sp. 2S1]QIG94440.1 hypothetical protein G6P99_19505 [Bradyrhizobium sp. 6(2017)]